MVYTSKMAFAGTAAARNLSPAAYAYYETLRPFYLYEYDTPDGLRYAYAGVIGEKDGLTFDGLQYVLEELARLTDGGITSVTPPPLAEPVQVTLSYD